uniref:Uncharacterized protein n=1 Tax=viral metagenome TaxID=1070528 RepID=A0A6M3Y318_9ZZZZ
MSLRDKVKDMINSSVIFLKGEKRDQKSFIRPLYTKEELKELYNIKKSLEKFKEKDEDYM